MEIKSLLIKNSSLFKFPLEIDTQNISISILNLNSIDVLDKNLNSKNLEEFNTYIKSQNSDLLVGGYLEKRSIYDSSDVFNDETQRRSIHVGVDLWIDSNANVVCPYLGEIHSFNYNSENGDYGGTIILKHLLEGIEFYTLYGHLSRNSLENLYVGKKIKTGEIFAKLGSPDENGNWPIHLHFQLITDMLNYRGDFPGVVKELELDYWKDICLDPNLILNLKLLKDK